MSKKLSGTALVGGNSEKTRTRVENDYYATDPKSTIELLENYQINHKGTFLEPSVGGGHIVEAIKEYYGDNVNIDVDMYDIVDRGYKGTVIQDFLTLNTNKKYDNIIANPPYKLATEFVYKGLTLLNNKGTMAMFLKIQFLEGVKRKKLFEEYPPKQVLVFSKRQSPLRNGQELDENGKPWSSTMCFAWFVWEEGFKGDTVIKWI